MQETKGPPPDHWNNIFVQQFFQLLERDCSHTFMDVFNVIRTRHLILCFN